MKVYVNVSDSLWKLMIWVNGFYLVESLKEFLGHKYCLTQFGIPTFCEFCSNIIWIMEKGSVCQGKQR